MFSSGRDFLIGFARVIAGEVILQLFERFAFPRGHAFAPKLS
jgi:hypothetical protein